MKCLGAYKMKWRIQNELARKSYKGAYNKKRTCPEARSYKYKFINPTANAGLCLMEYITTNVNICGRGDLLQKI